MPQTQIFLFSCLKYQQRFTTSGCKLVGIKGIRVDYKNLVFFYNLHIYFAFLPVCLFVRPFVSNKRQNVWTDRAKILCGTSHDPREGYGYSRLQKFVSKSYWFLLNFKVREQYLIHELFFVDYCYRATIQIKIEDGREVP